MERTSYQLQGQNGGVVIADTTLVTGDFTWISVANDAVISALETNLEDSAGLLGITLPAGFGFGGQTSSITLTSGVVIAYK